jgi:hypothetical protein
VTLEAWLPLGLALPAAGPCGRPLHGDANWQIVACRGGGAALIAKEELAARWIAAGLVEAVALAELSFGAERYRTLACGLGRVLAPLVACPSPGTKDQALAFARALRATRAADPTSPLHDALYAESIGRLLPTFTLTPPVADEVVLGRWLTGGAPVPITSFRRLGRMLSWLGPLLLQEVIEAAGFAVAATDAAPTVGTGEAVDAQREHAAVDEPAAAGAWSKPFELPGRPELERFFSEHVIDIIRHQERYRALGVGFPAAIVLHGPPGCGKTFAVEQLVDYLGWPCFRIDASSVGSPYIHETSRKVAAMFDTAMQNAPSVLIIDEMESFLADRESGIGASHHRVEEVAEFLRRIPEAAKNEVLVVGMTNRLAMIDPAIMRRGRFDHVVKVDYANAEEVSMLLDRLLLTLPHDGTVDVGILAQRLAGRPLSDVVYVVREGGRLAARAGVSQLGQSFLLAALDGAPPRGEENPKRHMGFV